MDKSYYTEPEDQRGNSRTWRLLFRLIVLTLLCLIACTSVSQLFYPWLPQVLSTLISLNSSIITSSNGLKKEILNQNIKEDLIYREVAINIPLTLDRVTVEVGTAVNQITDALRQLQSVNGSAAFALSNSPDYSGGIEHLVFQRNTLINRSVSVSDLIEHPSFIPTPTTQHGCTRIPTFHLGTRHWCYSHNIIGQGCADSGASMMYISMGALGVSSLGTPTFTTSATSILSDSLNRKSCSIVATTEGCDVLCSIVTQTEDQDYADHTPTPMIHGRLWFNGTYTERSLSQSLFLGTWAAQYPAVGSGIMTPGRVIFPFYGGVIPNSPLFLDLERFALFTHNGDLECRNLTQYQKEAIYSAYKPPKIRGSLWAQGFIVCSVGDMGNCSLKVINTSTVMMGAEGRLQLVGDSVMYYQRSSSWWPVGILYRLSLVDIIARDIQVVINSEPLPLSKFPRPTWTPGVCQKPNVCPAVCVTGVYQDLWAISAGETLSEMTFFGGYLEASTQRKDPWIGVANQYSWFMRRRLFKTSTEAAYSSSTCFRNTRLDRNFCLLIFELTDNLLGDWRIVPLLFELTIV
ncbi:hemagglutinin neuraminidase protein [avian paramyxovirus 5]|uniref:Hemagglutinin-neuraminidase n=1 Tax=avian paramyxovirus 5 TaxID=2560315 RepID=D3X608_9MONO|nr:hemagglutinin neuraminidase protein [Avian metaavulavirus 5]ADD39005.1 hemagglutinin neuraminidase protein [Avian metaavulavirus 5]